MPSKENTDLDIVQNSIGSFGRYHFFLTFAIFLGRFPNAWHVLGIVILAPPVEFKCSNKTFLKCSDDCPSHDFDKSIFEETIITQWDLVCDNAQLTNVAQLLFMFGVLLGNVLFGYLSDRFGRRNPLVWAVILQMASGTAAAFAPWFWLFVVLRMLCAAATGGALLTSFVLLIELVGEKYRTHLANLCQVPFILGHAMLGLFGYLIRDWHTFQMVISIPSVILVSYYWIIPESPRWILAVGNIEKSVEILQTIAKHNRLPTYNIKENVKKYFQNKSVTKQNAGNAYDLIRTKKMRIWSICLFINWFTVGMAFFGVAQYIGQIEGDMFVNITISGLVQLPGNIAAVFILDKLGRKFIVMMTSALCVVSLLCITIVPTEPVLITTILACIGILGISLAFTVLYFYSGEIFPTVIRNVGLGTCSMFSRIGSMIAPFIVGLGIEKPWLPPLIFGIISLIGTVACWWLPETLNCKLPDTIEEAEHLGKTTLNKLANTGSANSNHNAI